MPQFGYKKNGEIEFYAEYTIKGVDTMKDIFPPTKKVSKLLKLKDNQCLRDVYNVANKSVAVRRIFYDFLVLMFNELTSGGMLVFPGKTKANIALKSMPDETVKRLSSEGKLTKIDIVKARYKMPYFKFDFGPESARKDRHIKVPMKIWSKAFRHAENDNIKYTYYRKMLK